MKNRNFISAILACLGIAVAVTGVVLSAAYFNEEPILMEQPEQAKVTANAFMSAVCACDFEQASQMIQGTPSLGIDRESNDLVGKVFWDAYWESTEFELVGDCYATDIGVAQAVSLQCLDIDDVSELLRERSMYILQERIAQASDTSEIYDENNEYREDLVMSVLDQAAREILDEAEMVTVDLTIQMCFEDGQWKIVADKELIDAIFFGCLF